MSIDNYNNNCFTTIIINIIIISGSSNIITRISRKDLNAFQNVV